MKRMIVVVAVAAATGLLADAGIAEVKNPFAGNAEAIKEGEKIFDSRCMECHLDGTGGSGPNLTDAEWKYGGTDADVFTSVSKGRRGGMPSWGGELKEEDIWKVIAYVRTLKRR